MTPGLIDCHTHAVFGGHRAHEFAMRLAGASYEDIARAGGGIMSTLESTRQLDEESLFQKSLPHVRAMVRSGATTIEIKSGYGGDLKTELKMLRVADRIGKALKITVCKTWLAAHVLPPEYKDNSAAFIQRLIQEVLPVMAKSGLVDAVDAFCENIAFSAEEVGQFFAAARSYDLPVKIHAEQLSNSGGTQMAAFHDALSADHLEHATEDDVAQMAHKNMVAVILPGAFYFLGETQKPPIELFRKHDVPMAVATDFNPGSSPLKSLPLAGNMACTFFGMTTGEVLQGMTINAAKALGLSKQKGSLVVGKDADFAIWDTKSAEELIYWIGDVRPEQLFANGQTLKIKTEKIA